MKDLLKKGLSRLGGAISLRKGVWLRDDGTGFASTGIDCRVKGAPINPESTNRTHPIASNPKIKKSQDHVK